MYTDWLLHSECLYEPIDGKDGKLTIMFTCDMLHSLYLELFNFLLIWGGGVKFLT